MADSLRFELLGGLRVSIDGTPVTGFVSAKVQALFCYLAMNGRPHFRPALAALLWGEQSDVEAATNLRQALANLRRLLGPYLLITRQTVAFNPDCLAWLDVAQFEAYLDRATAEEALELLQAATELYQGDFLAGFVVRDAPAFEEWALAERERLRERALYALHTLAARHTARGEYAAGIAAATRVLALDPWREEAHRQLMLLLARSGQRSAALAQYETCRRILAEELGVEPMPETVALAERIRGAAALSGPPVPAPTRPLIGRVDEQAQIAQRLADPSCRLLTIVGPGGIGKTRLALQALADHQAGFLHGAYVVALASASSGEVLVSTIASAVGFSFYRGDDPKAQLLNYLHEKELLLLLDNFEQLIDVGSDLVAEILQRAPEVKLLVTTRERLQLQGEWLLELRGLRVPPRAATEAIENYSAVQLFLARARQLQADFGLSSADEAALVRICQLVEGMPLGIELAAAWVRVLACTEISREIEASLDFLSTTLRDVPQRQRSLRAVFDHSWRLLSERERVVFQQLAVFQGGFTRAAAAAVLSSELKVISFEQQNSKLLTSLASLVDKSLLRRSPAGRYELHELLRQYAAEKLQASAAQAHDLHCAYYMEFLRDKTEPLRGSEQQQALEQIGAEIENVRAAWQWAVAHHRVAALGQSLESLYRYYDVAGWFQEGSTAFSNAITALDSAEGAVVEAPERQAVVLGQLLSRRAWFCSRLGQIEQAEALWQRSLTLFREAQSDVRRETALALVGLGYLAILTGEYAQARSRSEEALLIFQAIGDQHGIADAFNNLGIVADVLGEYHEAKTFYQGNLALHKALGDRKGIARALHNLGDTSRLLGEYQEARELHQECLEIARAIGDHLLEAYSLACLGMVTDALGEHAAAQQFLQAGLDLFEAMSLKAGVELCYNQIGVLLSALGNYQAAERHFLKALGLADELRAVPEMLDVLNGLATNMARAGQVERPLELLALVATHPAGYQHSKESAEQLLADLQARLSPEVTTGKHRCTLDQVVAELLGQ